MPQINYFFHLKEEMIISDFAGVSESTSSTGPVPMAAIIGGAIGVVTIAMASIFAGCYFGKCCRSRPNYVESSGIASATSGIASAPELVIMYPTPNVNAKSVDLTPQN